MGMTIIRRTIELLLKVAWQCYCQKEGSVGRLGYLAARAPAASPIKKYRGFPGTA